MSFPHPDNQFIYGVKLLLKQKQLTLSAGAIVGLVAIALGTQTLFQDPNQLDGVPSSEETTSLDAGAENTLDSNGNPRAAELSDEDIRIGADIDNLAVLLSDIALSNDTSQDSSQQRQNPSRNSARSTSSLFDPAALATTASASAAQSSNRRGASPSMYDDLFAPITPSAATELSASIPSFLSTTRNDDSTAAHSNASLTTHAESTSIGLEQLPVEPSTLNREPFTDSIGSPTRFSASGRSDSNRLNHSSQNNLLNVGANPLLPGTFSQSSNAFSIQTSPLPGATGYTVPQSLQSPVNPYTQQVNPQFNSAITRQFTNSSTDFLPNTLAVPQVAPFSGSSNTTSVPGFNTPTSTTSTVPIIQQPVFSVPQNSFAVPTNPIPSNTRFNGGGSGGEINTFSNP